jgi:hypothetical protein
MRQMFIDESGNFESDTWCAAGGPVVSGAGPLQSDWVRAIEGVAPHVPWPPHAAHLRTVSFHLWAMRAGPRARHTRPADRDALAAVSALTDDFSGCQWVSSPHEPSVEQCRLADCMLLGAPAYREARTWVMDLWARLARAAVAPVADLVVACRVRAAPDPLAWARLVGMAVRAAEGEGLLVVRPSSRHAGAVGELREALGAAAQVANPAPFGERAHPAFIAADCLVGEARRACMVAPQGELSARVSVALAAPVRVVVEG